LHLLVASESLRQAAVEKGAARDAALASARSNHVAAWNSPAYAAWKRALLSQRAVLESLEGRAEQAAATREEAREVGIPASDDAFLGGLALLADGQGAAAAERFAAAAALRPDDANLRYFRGLAEQASGNLSAAEESLTAAIALAPQSYLSWFQRGVVRLEQSRFRGAADDFEQALRLRPSSPPALVNRGLAAQGQGNTELALRCFSEALEAGSRETRVYFLRAAAARKLGRSEQAAKDLREGLARTPADERSWNARGLARLPKDPQGALADFEQALELYPRSALTLRNKAHVLAEHLARPRDALAALDAVVATAPHDAAAWSGRGVLHGRLGQRGQALDDARAAVARTRDPLLTYQVACIFAQTSRTEPADAAEAVRLLAVAWQSRPDLVQLAELDPDLQPLAERTEYQSALAAAHMLAKLGRPESSPSAGPDL
jgi:Tfp pilus assembly protein PilF